MAIPLDKPVTFGPFKLGLNNVDRAMDVGTGEVLAASNLDIDRDGVLTRRSGYALTFAETDAHSLWARDRGTAFYAAGADLKLLTADRSGTLTRTIVRAGEFAAGVPIAYVFVNGDVYYSNGLITGRIRKDNSSHPWGVERPARVPVLSVGGGGLFHGRYQIALQFIDDQGEFGGMTQPVAIDVPNGSSIVVSGIPAAASPDVRYVAVFVSEQNSDILYRYGTYLIGTTGVIVSVSATPGRRTGTFLTDVMPPTSMLDYYNGRIYGAAGRVIHYTNALQYGQCTQRSNFIPWHDEITLLKGVTDGLYVGTDTEVRFLAGAEPQDFHQSIALPCGAIRGTGITLETGRKAPGAPIVGWMSERGFVKASGGGKVEIAEKERVSVGMYAAGAALYRELGEVRQIVATMRGGMRAAVVSTDHVEAEVRRNGVLI